MDSYLSLVSFLCHSILPGDYNEDFVFQVGLVMMVVWISYDLRDAISALIAYVLNLYFRERTPPLFNSLLFLSVLIDKPNRFHTQIIL